MLNTSIRPTHGTQTRTENLRLVPQRRRETRPETQTSSSSVFDLVLFGSEFRPFSNTDTPHQQGGSAEGVQTDPRPASHSFIQTNRLQSPWIIWETGRDKADDAAVWRDVVMIFKIKLAGKSSNIWTCELLWTRWHARCSFSSDTWTQVSYLSYMTVTLTLVSGGKVQRGG